MEEKLPRKYNAVKHGILSKEVILSQEDIRPYNKLNRQLLAELQPQSPLEMLLAEQIIINYWRLRRFLRLENEVLLFSGKPSLSIDRREFVELFTDFVRRNPSFDLLSRYNASILKSFYRAIHEYQNIKQAQKLVDSEN